MDILRVPHALYQEFSQKFGIKEERNIVNDGHYYTARELDPEKVGFTGAIGFRDIGSKEEPHYEFVLWGLVPKEKDESWPPKPVLIITSRLEEGGVWSIGQGHNMREAAKAEFSFYGMTLKAPSSVLIPLILQRAVILASGAKAEHFWEKEIHPDWNFTKP
jgi:hypothetical protein